MPWLRAVPCRFCRQALPSGGLTANPDQIAGHQAKHIAMLAANLVCGEDREYAGLDGAFMTHCRALLAHSPDSLDKINCLMFVHGN